MNTTHQPYLFISSRFFWATGRRETVFVYETEHTKWNVIAPEKIWKNIAITWFSLNTDFYNWFIISMGNNTEGDREIGNNLNIANDQLVGSKKSDSKGVEYTPIPVSTQTDEKVTDPTDSQNTSERKFNTGQECSSINGSTTNEHPGMFTDLTRF